MEARMPPVRDELPGVYFFYEGLNMTFPFIRRLFFQHIAYQHGVAPDQAR